jgi:hypothetical protein
MRWKPSGTVCSRNRRMNSPALSVIRTALLKIGALVTVGVRRVAMASPFPRRANFSLAHRRLRDALA